MHNKPFLVINPLASVHLHQVPHRACQNNEKVGNVGKQIELLPRMFGINTFFWRFTMQLRHNAVEVSSWATVNKGQ